MGAIASQITSIAIVYSTVYSDADKKTSKLRVTGLCAWNSPGTGEFHAQMASNAENVSIWWRRHVNSGTRWQQSNLHNVWLCEKLINVGNSFERIIAFVSHPIIGIVRQLSLATFTCAQVADTMLYVIFNGNTLKLKSREISLAHNLLLTWISKKRLILLIMFCWTNCTLMVSVAWRLIGFPVIWVIANN